MKEVSPRRRADQVSLLLVSQVRWEFEIDHWTGERNLAVVVVAACGPGSGELDREWEEMDWAYNRKFVEEFC